ncbi:DUF1616 domain-containing protein [Candidatus Methylocalor cossyra]
MWAGVGIFSLVVIVALSLFSSTGLVFKDLFGLVVVLILPGYTIVKLFFDQLEISENLTKNPTINRAVDKLIVSLGLSIASIIPLNFIWNYLLTMGGGEGAEGNIWGNVEEEMIYSGSASWRALFTVILVIGVAVGIKLYRLKTPKT